MDNQSGRPSDSYHHAAACFAALVFAIMVSASATLLFAADQESAIAEATRRTSAIKSGRLEYRFESGIGNSKVIEPQRLPTQILAFSGTDWIERGPEVRLVLANRGQSFLQLDQIRQEDGKLHMIAVLAPARSFKDREHENRRPWFAGSFWHSAQLEHVQRNIGSFRQLPSGNVGGIPCEVFELDVPGESAADAFQLFSPLLNAGGKLRLHIAPRLGFAIPLIEIISRSGVRVVAYEAKEWQEFPDGIYFPRLIRRELQAPNGSIEFEQFSIEPTLIGQPIPDAEFSVAIPAGTHVRDERDVKQVRRFTLKDSVTFETLSDATPEGPKPPAIDEQGLKSRLVWPLAAIVAFAMACYLISVWRRKTR